MLATPVECSVGVWSALGFVLMLNGQFGVIFMVTGLFIALNARAEIMTSYVAEQLDGVKVRDLTFFGIAQAGTDMDTDSMIDQRQRLGAAGAVAVVGDDGELDGLVLEDQLWAVPSENRSLTMLTQLMVPFTNLAQGIARRGPVDGALPSRSETPGRHRVERRQAPRHRAPEATRRAVEAGPAWGLPERCGRLTTRVGPGPTADVFRRP